MATGKQQSYSVRTMNVGQAPLNTIRARHKRLRHRTNQLSIKIHSHIGWLLPYSCETGVHGKYCKFKGFKIKRACVSKSHQGDRQGVDSMHGRVPQLAREAMGAANPGHEVNNLPTTRMRLAPYSLHTSEATNIIEIMNRVCEQK